MTEVYLGTNQTSMIELFADYLRKISYMLDGVINVSLDYYLLKQKVRRSASCLD